MSDELSKQKAIALMLLLRKQPEQVRYEPGPPMSSKRLQIKYKTLYGKEYVIERLWVDVEVSNGHGK